MWYGIVAWLRLVCLSVGWALSLLVVVGGLGGLVIGLLGLVLRLGLVGVAVDELHADLLGQGQLNLLALGLTEAGGALLHRDGGVLDGRLVNALLLGDHLTAEDGDLDGLGDTGLDGLWESHPDIDVLGLDLRHIVGSLLLDLLAVLPVALLVAMLVGWLAHSHHLHAGFLLEGYLHGLRTGILVLLLVVIGADLELSALIILTALSASQVIAVLTISDGLHIKINILTVGLEGGSAHLGNLNHILNRAVVLGVLIAVRGLVVGGLGIGGLVVGGAGRVVAVRVARDGGARGQGEDEER